MIRLPKLFAAKGLVHDEKFGAENDYLRYAHSGNLMMMDLPRRSFLKKIAVCGASAGAVSLGACTQRDFAERETSFSFSGNFADIFVGGINRNFRVAFVTDVHLALDETLAEPFATCAGYGERNPQVLAAALEKAKSDACEAVVNCGDMINYPSPKNVEAARRFFAIMPTLYVAGNHDWHYEGDSGSDAEQLDFLKRELSESVPTIVCVHIPFYIAGRSVFFGCGNPEWGGQIRSLLGN